MTKILPKGIEKGHIIQEKEKKLLHQLRGEYNKENSANLTSKEFLEQYVLKCLGRFRSGKLEATSTKTPSSKSAKGVSILSSKDETTVRRVRALQTNSVCRTVIASVYETMTALEIVGQKMQSIIDLLDDVNAIQSDVGTNRFPIRSSTSAPSSRASSNAMKGSSLEQDDMSFLLGEDLPMEDPQLPKPPQRASLLESLFEPFRNTTNDSSSPSRTGIDNPSAHTDNVVSSHQNELMIRDDPGVSRSGLSVINESSSSNTMQDENSDESIYRRKEKITSLFTDLFDEKGMHVFRSILCFG